MQSRTEVHGRVRYSVLLPTRNGGALLAKCVESVLREAYSDMELIVSDNASEADARDVLRDFVSDERLRVIRCDEPISVTDNWNTALERSSGERILLLGDDDLLLPGYFERVDQLLDMYGDPDVLSYNAYAFAYPGFGGSPISHYADPFFEASPAVPRSGLVPIELRRELVAETFRFSFPIALNMQTVVVARQAIAQLASGIFKEPFPDFYAINALLLRAHRWAHNSDERLVVVGVSPKSFGRTLTNQVEQRQGVHYLGIDTEGFPGRLPGSEFLNGTYKYLLALREDYPAEIRATAINRQAYVLWQVYAWYVQMRIGSLDVAEFASLFRRLRPLDWALLLRSVGARLQPRRVARRLRFDRDDPARFVWPGMQPLPGVGDITQFADWLAANEATET